MKGKRRDHGHLKYDALTCSSHSPIDLIVCTLAASVRCAVGDRACHRLGEAAVAPVIHMQPVG
jgi:hypothetical protein